MFKRMKKILITGSADGIGKLTALKMAEAEHQVFLHGRNEAKLEAVIEEVKTQTENSAVSGFVADFSDLEQVRDMSEEVKSTLSFLDVLINNAGVFKTFPQNRFGARYSVCGELFVGLWFFQAHFYHC